MVPAVGFWVEILRRISNNLLYISVENTGNTKKSTEKNYKTVWMRNMTG